MNLQWFVDQQQANPPGTWRRESSVATGKAVYGLISLVQPRHVVEVGTYLGHTTAWIARALIENGAGTASSFDVDQRFLDSASGLVAGAVGNSAPIAFHCKDITKRDDPIECDFAFIDPDPKSLYLPVFRKLALANGATLCAHDLYYQAEREHVVALQRVLIDEGWEVIGFPQERGLLVARLPQ